MAGKKTKKPKNPFYKKIVTFLKKKHGKFYKKKELSRALNVDKANYYLFREALNDLARSGEIARLKGGQYAGAVAQEIIRGELQMTNKGFAFVTPDPAENESDSKDIFIAGSNLNTALDGDTVTVKLLANTRGKNREGRVTEVLSRARTRFVGVFHKSEYYGFVVPDNPKVYRDFFTVEGKDLSARDGQKVVVELEKWDRTQLNPEGRILEILGYPDEAGVDVSSIVIGYGLPIGFTEELEEEAAKSRLGITNEELSGRLDLRDEIIFTIDPPDAKDYDDAVSLKKLENGNSLLGVHIADVSHFVKEGSKIDQEALSRGTSIYLVDRVIPMLPEHLSNELCSLQPRVDRLTYSCLMEIDSRGNVRDYRIKKSVINSKRRFTYREVQDIIDDARSKDSFEPVIKEMHQLSRMLRKKREQAGSIDFETPEVRFRLDEKGRPLEIIPVESWHSNQMIEEFMLLTNQTVTLHINKIAGEKKPNPFIYRVHERPDREKLEKFRVFLKALGHDIQINHDITPLDFRNILGEVLGGADDVLIKEVALRTMMKAAYSLKNAGHFGLAFQYYTHFTSPIRRYPDLAVHRLLKEYQEPTTPKRREELRRQLQKVCERSSQRERVALEAERESIKLKQVEWIEQHQDEEFEGLISGVTSFGVFVETMPYLIEGLIRMEDLSDDFYIYDEKTYSLTGRRTGRVLRLGDPVRVKVASVNPDRKEVDFLLLGD